VLCTQIVRLQEFPRAKLQGGPQDTLIIHSKQKQGLDAITRHDISFSSLGSAFDTNVPLCHLLLLSEYGDWERMDTPQQLGIATDRAYSSQHSSDCMCSTGYEGSGPVSISTGI